MGVQFLLLFGGIVVNPMNVPSYAVSKDGDKFLHFISKSEQAEEGIAQNYTALVVVENWFEELKRLAPPYSQ